MPCLLQIATIVVTAIGTGERDDVRDQARLVDPAT
jgi:hypothetical protein